MDDPQRCVWKKPGSSFTMIAIIRLNVTCDLFLIDPPQSRVIQKRFKVKDIEVEPDERYQDKKI